MRYEYNVESSAKALPAPLERRAMSHAEATEIMLDFSIDTHVPARLVPAVGRTGCHDVAIPVEVLEAWLRRFGGVGVTLEERMRLR